MRIFLEDVRLFVEMLSAYFRGRYPSVPLITLASIIFALLYIIDPFDAVPDFIPVIGFTDDAAIITTCVALCKTELDKFKNWKAENK